MKIKDRIKEFRRVKASELAPNPKNWRVHPKAQKEALRGILADIGFAGAVLARETPEGLMLIDGHLRTETCPDSEIPCLILDVTEDEGNKILATFDPLSAMADSNAEALDGLLRDIQTDNQALAGMLTDLAKDAGLYKTDSESSSDSEEEEDDAPPAGVRMVQLFFDENNIANFQECCEKLSKFYKTENLTDTVLEAIRRESSSL